ncbi:MAG: AAA family ATPase [Caldilineaceae bacterium]|nr:AAA family ATPase [Caldilineaceae bacterium]
MSTDSERDSTRPSWFVGAAFGGTNDQSHRFVREGIWENGYKDRFIDEVKSIQVGDRIAIKSTYTRKRGLPFDNQDRYVSVMAIKAIGTVKENLGTGRTLRVNWKRIDPPREWYFYTYQPTVWKVEPGTWEKDSLIEFAFEEKPQDINSFLESPFWGDRYGKSTTVSAVAPDGESALQKLYTCDLKALETELHLTSDFLTEIQDLLYSSRQVIFQGPPGTGKTYVAQELAECLAGGNENSVTLVQFHPSYAYEDFVRGFRPSVEGGPVGFELQDGPLLQAAEKARAGKEVDPEAKHFLIIDEINRGNIAKVFGELYFLLEYRDRKISLQYQREPGETFSLPENLYIIGTMNTADRSIALVDLALRRRFYFIEFHPDDEPVKSVLRKWLGEGSELEWVADVVEEANRQLEEYKHAAIGPSYFMKYGLRKEDVPRIWKHSVLPYIEELLFGDDTKIHQLQLKELCETVAPHIYWSDGDENKDDNANSNSEVVNDATDQPSGVPGEQSNPS